MDIYMVWYFVIAFVIWLIYTLIEKQYTYWIKNAVPSIEPSFPYGNLKGYGKTQHISDVLKEIYKTCKDKTSFSGMWFYLTPVAVGTGLDFVKDVLVKDISNFMDKGWYYNEKDEPLSASLFAVEGELSKNLRNKITPDFISNKMKYLFPTVVDVGKEFQKTLQQTISTNSDLELTDLCSRYIMDVIGKSAFGVECNSLKDPNNYFRVMGKRALTERRHHKLVESLCHLFPNVAKFLEVKLMPQQIHDFYMNLVKETVELRGKNNVRKNDFLDVLLELKKGDPDFTTELIAVQLFAIFVACYQSISLALSFCLFELAKNNDIQQKLRNEILDVLKKHDGKFVFEEMSEMEYTQKVVFETLRKYPSSVYWYRKAKDDYPLPDGIRKIAKGTTVLIPVHSFHHDPEIYEDPDKFDPERFTPEAIAKRHPCSFLPFSDGPRNCAGTRFAKMMLYVGLVSLVSKFQFSFSRLTQDPVVIDLKSKMYVPKDGIYLKVENL